MYTQNPTPTNRWLTMLDTLATPHGLDRYLEWLRPTWTVHQVRATVSEVFEAADGSVTLRLLPNHCWAGFSAGQHVELSVEIDGVRHTRCYSLASSAHDAARLELTVKVRLDGKVSRWLRDHARPGQVFDLSPAQGAFVMPDPRPERLLLVSGGSGITPVLSMLRTLCDEGHSGPVTFLHYAERPATLPYAKELREIAAAHPNVRVALVFSEEPDAGDFRGRFGAEQLREVEPEYASAETFVCGPDPLMDAVRQHFAAEELTARLHAESFRSVRYRVRTDATKGRINFNLSDIEIESDGRTLLEQAEAAGLRPASGCRRGICHTCVCRMTAGTLRNVVTGATITATDTEVQPCIHAPAGDVNIDL